MGPGRDGYRWEGMRRFLEARAKRSAHGAHAKGVQSMHWKRLKCARKARRAHDRIGTWCPWLARKKPGTTFGSRYVVVWFQEFNISIMETHERYQHYRTFQNAQYIFWSWCAAAARESRQVRAKRAIIMLFSRKLLQIQTCTFTHTHMHVV